MITVDSIPLTKEGAMKLAKDLKFTVAQAFFVAEILTFHKLLHDVCKLHPNSTELECLSILEESAEFRKFRLDVKRRILNDRGDLKERTVTKERKQKVLEELFDVEYKRYCLAIK
jgi:hypothetical protein